MSELIIAAVKLFYFYGFDVDTGNGKKCREYAFGNVSI